MGTTLAQYAKLSNDILRQGIIETICKDSPLWAILPWIEIQGNALTYNRELTLPNAEWHAVNDDWTTSPGVTFTQKTATLAILGQNADVDNYVRQTRSNINDIETAIIELTAKAIRNELEDKFLYGNSTTDPNQFDGLIAQIATGTASDQVIAAGASGGAAITLDMIDQLIDAVKGGAPDLLLMSRRSRRKISALARAAGNNLEHDNAQFGFRVEYYGGIPIQISDFIKDTHTVSGSVETVLSGAASSTIYAISLGEDGVAALTGSGLLNIVRMGQMETKDATRTRIKMYAGLALFSNVKAAALIGCA